jgi:hypothetical protein
MWMDTRDYAAHAGGWDVYTDAYPCAGKWDPGKNHWVC